ncbi:hypothetical protein F5146DRAFT_1139074 [Armillaria mellea]|nr:hypothetical protein F5146DRAFT_1139074 [Armillaria mellea]
MAAPNQKITTPTIAGIKEALALFQEETDKRRKNINARLAQKKLVSAEDEVWLDEAGNPVEEALKAVSTLQQYVGSMDDPFFRQLEGILAPFGRKTHLEEAHSLKDTEITMYFTTI